MSPRKILLPLALVILTASARAFSNTWYVDASAAPPGNGTIGSPYASIQYAHDQATTVDDDLILVAPGTYFENLTLIKLVTVRATGGAESTTLRPLVAGTVLTMQGVAKSFDLPAFEGFRITGAFGPPLTAAVRSFEGTLSRCIVEGTPGAGHVGIVNEFDAIITRCTIAGNDIGILHADIWVITYLSNTILWNRVNGSEDHSRGDADNFICKELPREEESTTFAPANGTEGRI